MDGAHGSWEGRPDTVDEQVNAGLPDYESVRQFPQTRGQHKHTQHIQVRTNCHGRDTQLKLNTLKLRQTRLFFHNGFFHFTAANELKTS